MRVPVFITVAFLALVSWQKSRKVEIYILPVSSLKVEKLGNEFTVKDGNLPPAPFITDEEITAYDTARYRIHFSVSAASKIGNLKPALPFGVPFVLTVNREPVLTGYFHNIISSFGVQNYMLLNVSDTIQHLSKGLPEYLNMDLKERRKSGLLLEALSTSGRLR